MESLTKQSWYYLNDYWDEIADPRVDHFPLVGGGIWKILLIMSTYLVITRVLLPRYMRNRKAYVLRNTMLFYNTTMVFANAFAFYWAVIAIDYGRIFLDFRYPSREDRSSQTLWYLYLGWWFWMTRFGR